MPGFLSKLEQIAVPASIGFELDFHILMGPNVHRLHVLPDPAAFNGFAEFRLGHLGRWPQHDGEGAGAFLPAIPADTAVTVIKSEPDNAVSRLLGRGALW